LLSPEVGAGRASAARAAEAVERIRREFLAAVVA
jgi:hypothetical protein